MRRSLLVCLLGVVLAGCGGGDDDEDAGSITLRSTTTTAEVSTDCDLSFEIPLESIETEDCLSFYLRNTASQEGVELTAAAELQAVALCRESSMSGLVEGMAAAYLGWEEGSRPSPVADEADEGTFVAMAVGLYCPEHYDQLRRLND